MLREVMTGLILQERSGEAIVDICDKFGAVPLKFKVLMTPLDENFIVFVA